MREHLSNALRSFVCSLAACALGALLIAMMLALYDIPRTVLLAVLPWALLLLSLALICELIAARDGNLLVYLFASGLLLFFGGEAVVDRTQFIPGSSGFPVLLRLLVYASGAACAYAVQKLPPSDIFVRLGDALIITLACYLSMCFFLGDAMISSVLALAFAALSACLAAAALLRAGGESERVVRGAGTGGMLILAALLGSCMLAAAGLLGLVSGRIDSLVHFLLTLWRAAIRVISRAFEFFVRFIAFFAPKPVQYNMTPTQQDSLALSASGLEVTAQMPRWVIILFIAFIILLAIAAVLGLLWVLRGTKLNRSPRRRKARRVTRQSRMMETLLARLRAIREMIVFELAYRRHRRTPQGLYVLAVRACRLSRRKKLPSESPAVFIRRLHDELLENSSLSTLDALADKLNRTLYSGESVPLSRGESDAFAAQIQTVSKLPIHKKPASM